MMPHADEGTLHALIDGALRAEDPARAAEVERHLATCEDCRARLDEARALHEDASRILAEASPAGLGHDPAFAEVTSRAGRRDRESTRRRAAVSRQLGWTRSLAWAATIVLALGTGYLLRDMVGGDAVQQRSPEAPAGAPAESRARTPAEATGRTPAAEAADADRTTDPAGRPNVASGDAGALDSGDRAAAPAESRTDPPPAPSPSPPPPSAEDAAEPGRQAAGQLAPSELRAVGPRASARMDAARWSATDVDGARAVLEGPLYVLPQATLREVYVVEDAPVPTVVTLQELQTGVPLRVVQRRPATGRVSAEAQEEAAADLGAVAGTDEDLEEEEVLPGTEVAQVTVGSFTLEIRGTLPAELLAILGESARPAR